MLPVSLIIILVLWSLGFMLIERASLLSGMVGTACFIFPILIITSALEYVTENSGTLSAKTLALSSTTQSQLVLIDVFFLFIALINMWNIVTGIKKKPDD